MKCIPFLILPFLLMNVSLAEDVAVSGVMTVTDPVWNEEPATRRTFDKTDLTALIVANTPDELVLEIPFASDWNDLVFHIAFETNFDAVGAPGDPFEMPVIYGHALKPDYVLSTKYSSNDYGDFRRWTGTGWEFWNPQSGSYREDGNIQNEWVDVGPASIVIRIPSEVFGTSLPDSMKLEAYLTQDPSGGPKRSAFDSVPSDSTLNLTFDYEDPEPGDWDTALGPVTLEAWSPVFHPITEFPAIPLVRRVQVSPEIVDEDSIINILAEVFDMGDGIGKVVADLGLLGGSTTAVLRDDGDERSGDRFPGDGLYGILWEVPGTPVPGTYVIEVRAYDTLGIQYMSADCLVEVLMGAPILQATDPVGDDHGPNQPGERGLYYIYPTNHVFVPGAFDLTGLKVYESAVNVGGEMVEMLAFEVSVVDFPDPADPETADWSPFYADMNVTKIDIFIDSAPGGTLGSLPWRQAGFQPWDAWDWAIVMDGWYKALIPSMGSESLYDWRNNALRSDQDILLLGDPHRDTVTALVSRSALGNPTVEEVVSWDICVAMASHDFGGEEVLGGIRWVNDGRSEWNFGGGSSWEIDSNYLDLLLVPGLGHEEGRPQEYLLDYESQEAIERRYQGLTSVALEMSASDPSSVPSPASMGVTLYGNAPNPFNPRTAICFTVPEATKATLRVFDVSGRLVATLMKETSVRAGRTEVVWAGTDDSGRFLPSGAYFYRLETRGACLTRRMTLLK